MPCTPKYLPLLFTMIVAACGESGTGSSSDSAFDRNPCLGPDTLTLAVAQAARVDCSNGGTTVTLAGGGASYLVVPQFATNQAANMPVLYSVASGDVTAAAARRSANSAAAGPPRTLGFAGNSVADRPGAAQLAADRWLRSRGHTMSSAIALHPALHVAPHPAMAPPAMGSYRSFHVLSNFTTGTFKNVSAQLNYVGSNVLLYMDSLAPAGFTPAQLQNFGQYFDQVLFPIDTTAFGVSSDVDGNGRVIVLMSPVVNADTPSATCASSGYVAGFFFPLDFLTTDANSNQGEVFYSIVPDPAGQASCAHSVGTVDAAVPSVFLHELQHLINFSQHVVLGGGSAGDSWLDEGLSIVAEELGSVHYEQQCPPPACRANPSQLFPDSSQGFVAGLLYDSYQFALLPDTASITLNTDSDFGISWRGGAWLLARWLGDQFGTGIYRQLERGPADGVADIAAATGRPFPQLFADFGLALYTDSLPGLARTTAPAANRFVTRNVKQLWARLFATGGPSADIPLAAPLQLFSITPDTSANIMVPGTMTYFRLDTPAGVPTVSIRFAGPGGAAFPATLEPQLAIFRLPAGQ